MYWTSSSTHWGRVMHICISKLTIIGSDNGLSPGRHQAIIWTNAGLLLTGPLGTKYSEILIEIHTFSYQKLHLKMLSAKWQQFCHHLNVLRLKLPCYIYPCSTKHCGRGMMFPEQLNVFYVKVTSSAILWLIILNSCNHHMDGLVQERPNSSALAVVLHLSCTNPSILNYYNAWIVECCTVHARSLPSPILQSIVIINCYDCHN